MIVYLKRCLPLLFVLGTSLPTIAQPAYTAISDKLQPASSATISGFVGEKLDAAYNNRILAQDIQRLIQPFQNRTEDRCWQTEFWGKWFTSAVQAYRYKPGKALKQALDSAVAGLIRTQTPDGYIGNYAADKQLEQWDIWGRKYCMLGLIAYYDLTQDKKSLQAAGKLADHLMKELADKKVLIVQKGNHRGMAATSVLEPITQLYVRTRNPRYLDFAEEIVREWESPAGPQLVAKAGTNVSERFPIPEKSWWGYEQGQKAYEMMSCYEGLLELYRITGKSLYRLAVEKVWENIRDTEINVAGSGSSMECWFGGRQLQPLVAKHYQETCVTATWIKLSQQLLRLTGDPRYADAIEQSFYNALLGSMKPDGSTWAKYSPLIGIRSEGEDQCHMGLNCCVASGPRGLFTIPLTTVMQEKEGLLVNFFNPGSYQVKTPAGQLASLVQQTDYPLGGVIDLQLSIASAEKFILGIRIPAWSKQTSLTVNGTPVSGIEPGKYITINREWKSGDKLQLTLDMRGRIETIEGKPAYQAVLRGPVVLVRDKRLSGSADVDETITPVLTKEGFIAIEPVPSPDKNIWMSFRMPCMVGSYRAEESSKPVALLFCDYASAGNTYTEESYFRSWFPQLLDPSKKGTAE
ncbi:MAG: glycoside hydrolase family 127 protein [Williamsia sp.]|nr:glycoside hydrolase family 127 protein [Williamsia sp.]